MDAKQHEELVASVTFLYDILAQIDERLVELVSIANRQHGLLEVLVVHFEG